MPACPVPSTPLPPAAARLCPLLQRADFERVLAVPSRARSRHFAVHHLADRPAPSRFRVGEPVVRELSTADAPSVAQVVDKSAPAALWLGTVVPKRHARRSVTRSLIKRQMRAAVARHAALLPLGLWVVRLRAGFDSASFHSAASDALRSAVRDELDAVLQRVRD